jgi:hypothetical protein
MKDKKRASNELIYEVHLGANRTQYSILKCVIGTYMSSKTYITVIIDAIMHSAVNSLENIARISALVKEPPAKFGNCLLTRV